MSGGRLSRGFDLNCGRDEMTSGGAREHRIEQLVSNIEGMDLDPEAFEFYVAGFRHGVPPRGLGAWCGSYPHDAHRSPERA